MTPQIPCSILLLAGLAMARPVLHGAEKADAKKVKPYPLKTCVVSGKEIQDTGAMKPHAFVIDGQQVKLCCESCLKDFNKDKDKYLRKIRDEAAKPMR